METKTVGGETLYSSTLDVGESQLLDTIYKFSDDMAATKEYEQLAPSFKALLQAATGSTRVKALVAGLLPKHAQHFPEQSTEAVDAIVALAGDAENTVRLPALKGLVQVCKTANGKAIPEAVRKVTDFLARVLNAKDKEERHRPAFAALEALSRLAVQDVCEALLGLLEAPESESEEPDALRETACQLLQDKICCHATDLLHPFPEVEEAVKGRVIKVLEVASESEFKTMITVLATLKIFAPEQKYGPQGLADLIAEQAALADPLEPAAVEDLQRVLECANIALPFLKNGAKDNTMSVTIVEKIMPVFAKLEPPHQLLVLQRLTDLSPHVSKEAAGACVPAVFDMLLAELPDTPAAAAPNGDVGASGEAAPPLPDVAFTLVEALLALVHRYGHKNPEQLATASGIPVHEGTEGPDDKYRAFKEKLLYTYEVCESMSRRLHAVIPKAKAVRGVQEQERKQTLERGQVAVKNISDLCRPLVTAKPSCLHTVPSGGFSWQASNRGTKRTAAPAADSPAGKKGGAGAYVPPSRRAPLR